MQDPQQKVKILGASALTAKMRRMAFEIYERAYGREDLVVVGIGQRGGFVANILAGFIGEISPIKVILSNAPKNKQENSIVLDEKAAKAIRGRLVIVVDDVLYSGKTMFQALAAVMEHEPEIVQTAVLIDRGHRHVPVTHDYVGMVLATSLKQYVNVEVAENEKKAVAYLY